MKSRPTSRWIAPVLLVSPVLWLHGCASNSGSAEEGSSRRFRHTEVDLEQAALAGDADAQYRLGRRYFEGDGVAQDLGSAAHWFRLAAERGHPRAQTDLGYMYGTGHGVQEDHARAERLYRGAADRGSVLAQFNLGALFELDGRSEEAVLWYEIAAAGGNESAEARLAALRDPGARRNAEQAQYRLGLLLGERGDLEGATTWLDRAAAGGHPDAAVAKERLRSDWISDVASELADELEWLDTAPSADAQPPADRGSDPGIPSWLREKADDGDPAAQFWMGVLLMRPPDIRPEKSTMWFERAIAGGEPRAKNGLACAHLFGLGVPRDLQRARELAEEALAEGVSEAQITLDEIAEEERSASEDGSEWDEWVDDWLKDSSSEHPNDE